LKLIWFFQKKIADDKYKTLGQLESDVNLLVDNAQTYNIEGSEVSTALKKYKFQLVKESFLNVVVGL